MDDDWTPPTEDEIKLIEARRARSDQISKLMSGYLLKGYKMLGAECSTCGTILLQDRSNVKHCVACEELECDTEKDNPALRPPGAPSQSIKDEITASTSTLQTTAVAASALSSPRVVLSSPRRTGPQTPRINNEPPQTRLAGGEEGAEYLSMSSIDVHCWPAHSKDLGRAHAAGDSLTNPSKTGPGSAASPHSSLRATGTEASAAANTSASDITSCLSVLQAKICWASEALEQNHCVDSSTELCKLIKAAAEAIVAVRKASI
ncbi:hypothetical protein EGW08_016964 [Elysia chlorotica]|uniref:Sjoegren syndrome/scleroderma autoantigen 1 n=1 Tax=Elysia chlorotica TaxID=188477 RepID=A0A3S1AY68_ELYCH|nr:hypothetical protein EGW08_016964 [Elysia chlorotica]